MRWASCTGYGATGSPTASAVRLIPNHTAIASPEGRSLAPAPAAPTAGGGPDIASPMTARPPPASAPLLLPPALPRPL